MKKNIITILLIVAILMLTVTTAFAAGDKQRGDVGDGCIYQWQWMDPPPFQSIGIMLYQTSWDGNFISLYSY